MKAQKSTTPPQAADTQWPAIWCNVVFIVVLIFQSVLIAWAYWPSIVDLVRTWRDQPDYTHGFFVIPIAILLLYFRRSSFPGFTPNVGWGGLGLLLLSVGLRFVGMKFFVTAFEGWSIILWLAGVTWIFAGWPTIRWSWPVLAFLIFMVPLPYSAEMLLSAPLQQMVTLISTWSLQVLGEPALAEGNMIYLPGQTLEVAQACSGLRILTTAFALGTAFAISSDNDWFKSFLVLLAAAPIALLSNTFRIVLTGMMLRYGSGELTTRWIHDFPGWLMVPLTIVMFWLLAKYLEMLLPDSE